MKTGKTIQELSQELIAIRESSRDLIVPTNQLAMTDKSRILAGNEEFGMTNWTHTQLSQYTNIPKQYYDRILSENPFLLAGSVNHGLQMAINKAIAKNKDEARMLRTVGGSVRGFLSSRYRRLDSYDLLETVMPILISNQFQVKSSQLTEKKLYLKSVTPKIEGEIKVGHPVQYGLAISSSDVGCGSLQVSPFMHELRCTNGMTMEQSIRKFHIGRNQAGDDIQELLTDETKEAGDKAFWMEVKDIVNGTMKPEVFERQLNRLRDAADEPIKNFKLDKVVELTMKETGITGDKFKDSILAQLANGADGRGLNKWGIANAFTGAYKDVEDATYEECTDLERAGGKIIELSKKKWESIAA